MQWVFWLSDYLGLEGVAPMEADSDDSNYSVSIRNRLTDAEHGSSAAKNTEHSDKPPPFE